MRTRTSRQLLAAGLITAATLAVPAVASAAPEPVPAVPSVTEMQSWTPEQMRSFMETPGHDAFMSSPAHLQLMQSPAHEAFMEAVGSDECMG
jgi:hypothetical protein